MSEKICFAMIRFALVFLIAACQEYQIQEIKEVTKKETSELLKEATKDIKK